MKNKKKQLVAVYWKDAWSAGGWGMNKDLTPVPVISVGFLHAKIPEGGIIGGPSSK